jgi:hypothetical protein
MAALDQAEPYEAQWAEFYRLRRKRWARVLGSPARVLARGRLRGEVRWWSLVSFAVGPL